QHHTHHSSPLIRRHVQGSSQALRARGHAAHAHAQAGVAHGLEVEACAIVLHLNAQQIRLRLSATYSDMASATVLDNVGQRFLDQSAFLILLNLFTAAAILWFAVTIIYADEPVPQDNFLLAFSLAMIATLLWAFIGRLTREGRKVMDGIDGLRLYLELAEKDRMALAGAPSMSPS